ncbi:MAG: hypothetical protein KJZ78_24395, partial [Bryobacteraceae bacterium]|nr:hypothetical protein [Bryobacteraceae bacterium]
MPGKSQAHTDAVLNVLRGTTINGVATPYVGLFSVVPADDAGAGTELAGNGYQRQAITFGAPVTDAGNVRKVSNTNNISFGPATPGAKSETPQGMEVERGGGRGRAGGVHRGGAPHGGAAGRRG